MTATIEAPPRTPVRPPAPKRGPNLEKWGWIYMRVSGVVLIVLVFGHLFVNLLVGEGVHAIDFGFVGGKWADPFWQWWDILMLWLALIHGGNGMRTVVNDYTKPGTVQFILKGAILVAVVALIVLGTLVVFTFDPCPAGSPPPTCFPRSARLQPHRRPVTSENHVETQVVDGVHYHQYDIVIVARRRRYAGGDRGRSRREDRRHLQALPDPFAHGRGAGRHGRGARERRGRQLGVAHLRHRQGR